MPIITTEVREDNGSYVDKDLTIEALNVDYYGTKKYLKDHHIAARTTKYNVNIVISPTDHQDKYSTQYKNCIGFAGVGVDRNTGNDLSILSHICPDQLRGIRARFSLRLLKKSLTNLHDASILESLDLVIFGGRIPIERCSAEIAEYKNSIKSIAVQVEKTLGFEPLVAVGPSTTSTKSRFTSGLIQTGAKKLIIYRPPSISNEGKRNTAFSVDELDHRF